MNWEAIGALGETLGAILVLATLVYLANQVRYAKNAAADANRIARARGVCELNLALAQNPTLHRANTKANRYEGWYEELSSELGVSVEEAERADSISTYWFWLHWSQFAGTNREEDVAELRKTVGAFYASSPALKYSWNNGPFSKPIMGKAFIEFVDQAMATHSEKN